MRMKALAIVIDALICVYQWTLSPLLGPRCRYLPSCSDYAREAVHLHGAARGSWLAVKRICRCHPLGSSGYDPVPPARAMRATAERGG
jgi:putative membrane protein insertion efficiency factor